MLHTTSFLCCKIESLIDKSKSNVLIMHAGQIGQWSAIKNNLRIKLSFTRVLCMLCWYTNPKFLCHFFEMLLKRALFECCCHNLGCPVVNCPSTEHGGAEMLGGGGITNTSMQENNMHSFWVCSVDLVHVNIMKQVSPLLSLDINQKTY